MKIISLKIDDQNFDEIEKILLQIKKPRNRYINEAIENYNRQQKRLLLEERLSLESGLVKKESLNVLKEFESIDYAD